MTTFRAGDFVHIKGVGKGTVREVRNNGRYLIDVNGRAIVTTGDQLSSHDAPRKTAATKRQEYEPATEASASLDLHGLTVEEARDSVASFLNRALLEGAAEVRIIHGRSGGRLKAALHQQLKALPSIRGYAIDPRNPGVTIVRL